MPFASQKQRAYMYARHPKIAKRWRKEAGPQRGLPQRTGRDDKRQKLVEQFLRKSRGR